MANKNEEKIVNKYIPQNIPQNSTQKSSNIEQLNNLHMFIDKFRIIKQENISNYNQIKPTHISMGQYCGSFNIPDTKNLQFFKTYQNVIKAGLIPSVLETHLDQGPLLIDIDFKYILNNNTPNTRI